VQRKGEEAALLYAGAEIREKSQQAAQEEEQISKAAPWWCVPRVVCSSVCQRRRGGVVGCHRAVVQQLHHGGGASDAGRLFSSQYPMWVKTHPSLGRQRWRHRCHFLLEGDVEHLWL